MGGFDFVMPHRDLAGFGLVARAPDAGDKVSLAYSGCQRRDRGDEFDAAFALDRAAVIKTVPRDAAFVDALTAALLDYLRRKLRIVRYMNGDNDVVRTEVFWPDQPSGGQLLIWNDHAGGIALRKPTPVETTAAFDDGPQ